ncbi:hypothetical protein HYDPIDRAFT_104308 [Hydnomerulius pinastri MD-312]|nr:hypothetical protein HYDPIDRAFT_104308 [Hydnomerulius pinastri MD-312]
MPPKHPDPKLDSVPSIIAETKITRLVLAPVPSPQPSCCPPRTTSARTSDPVAVSVDESEIKVTSRCMLEPKGTPGDNSVPIFKTESSVKDEIDSEVRLQTSRPCKPHKADARPPHLPVTP